MTEKTTRRQVIEVIAKPSSQPPSRRGAMASSLKLGVVTTPRLRSLPSLAAFWRLGGSFAITSIVSILLVAGALLLTWLGVAVRCTVPLVTTENWAPARATRPGQVCRLKLRAAGGLRAPSEQFFHCPGQSGWEMRRPLSWRCVGCRHDGLVWEAEMTVWPVVREHLDKTLLTIYLPAHLELRSPEYAPTEQGSPQPVWENLPAEKGKRKGFSRYWAIPLFLYAFWRLWRWLSPRQRAMRRVGAANTPQELHEALLFFRPVLANELGEAMLNRVDELRFSPAAPSAEDFAMVKALALHLVS